MTILTREQIESGALLNLIECCENEFGPWNDGEPSVLRYLIDTALAFHDLRDAVLALCDTIDAELDAVTRGYGIDTSSRVTHRIRAAVESVSA